MRIPNCTQVQAQLKLKDLGIKDPIDWKLRCPNRIDNDKPSKQEHGWVIAGLCEII